ncbi:MAG: hypothetical protein WC399_00985 [Bacilli bacterium]|jgi:hypothetical protein
MKKSVILIISTISLLAVILIGLLFQRAEIYNETIYVNDIVITSLRIGDEYFPTYFDEEDDLYRLYDENKPGTPLTLRYHDGLALDIIYEVWPFDATRQTISFYTDPHSSVAQVDGQTGRISFLSEGTETFTLRATDNSNRSSRLRIRAKI